MLMQKEEGSSLSVGGARQEGKALSFSLVAPTSWDLFPHGALIRPQRYCLEVALLVWVMGFDISEQLKLQS